MRQAIFRDNTARLLIANGGVVNHRIKPAQAIDLLGHIAGLGNAGQIADNHAFRSRYRGQRLLPALFAASVQHHLVTLFDQQLGSHLAQAVGRTSDKDPRHAHSISTV
jgi:hypothetical protein